MLKQRTIPLIAASLLLSASMHAKPPIRSAFFSVYPSAVGSQLDNLPGKPGHCGVCHYDFNGGGTRNWFGTNVEATLALYPNTDAGKSNAIYSIRNLDPDADGYSTRIEVTDTTKFANTPTFPGLTPANTNLVSNISVSLIANYLVPASGGDTAPPNVHVNFPNGGQVLTANQATNVTWSASDASGVASVDIYLSLDNGASFRALALGLANAGSFSWVPANRPTTQARVKVVATDTFLNASNDISDAVFTIVSPIFTNIHGVPTTLRDFDMPGTQPFEQGIDLGASSSCASCHGGYEPTVEPQYGWMGSMMAHAARDPLFLANLALANQDAAESGDLCLRCHFARGWLAGRSVPTDGSRMTAADSDGVSCALCHRMVNPNYSAGVSPTNDVAILAALSFPGSNFGNGMFVIDPTGTRRGPFTNAAAPHAFLASSFHRSSAFCGTCHDVSNPEFQKSGSDFAPNPLNTTATNFSPHFMAPVERTYSEWLNSDYNSSTGIHAPQFAGNKPDGRVSTCQDCHMSDALGYGCNPTNNPPLRSDLPLHDLTGGNTWLPGLLTNLYPTEVNAAALQAGVQRAAAMLARAASLSARQAGSQFKVTVTNECGHKLPTGYPEGRRAWLNVRFYDAATNLLAESGAYDSNTGILTRDTEAKIYEIHPGIGSGLTNLLGLPEGPSFHFVLNNQVFSDNRIPPRGFTNANFAAFGGAPMDYSYADGQYWDNSAYTLPPGTRRAEVRLYYQSTSKEFVEFLRDQNVTNTKGQELYDLWNNNGKCPPTLIAEQTWTPIFIYQAAFFTPQGKFQLHFISRVGTTYTIQYTDSLDAPVWHTFQNHGTLVATSTESYFEDDFTSDTSGSPSPTGARFYRFAYNGAP